ncbi:hypothetical protein WJU16_13585 [Chitinophaga pollutisoli]|uniref:HEPN domain-containing protein n=1 Tax=Chitinophaga pollutisoli TaxID=3133966 RepID=A0ABZ2YJ61_9BACT
MEKMIQLHGERYPFGHHVNAVCEGLSNFQNADDDLTPICLKGKDWELIKLDIAIAVESFVKTQ